MNAHEAVHQIEAALSWLDARERLYCRHTAQPQLDEASQQLQGDCWSKVKRLPSDDRMLSHVDRLRKHLPSAVSEPVLRDALTRLSQDLLNLKRLYWNCRVFHKGKCKGKNPYDLLVGCTGPTQSGGNSSRWFQKS